MADLKTIVLTVPIHRGSSFVSGVRLRSPSAQDIEGVSMLDLVAGDDSSVISVLTRITTPALTYSELICLSQDSFDEMKVLLLTSLLTKKQRIDAGINRPASEGEVCPES